MKTTLSALAFFSLLATGAQANTVDWHQHDALEVGASMTPIGSFEDTYDFSLTQAAKLFSTAVSNNLTGVLGLTGGTVALMRESGEVDVQLGSFAFDGSTGNISYSFGDLGQGDYHYLVTGTGTGSMGGFYTISSTITPVPEPQSVALMLAGLGVMGFVALRRKS